MKKLLLATLTVTSLLQSCGQGHKASDPGNYKNTVKLGKFQDTVTESTFNTDELKDLPRMVNLKDDMTPVKNQSDRGACTFFSTAAMLEAAIKKDMKVEVNLSEEYLNYSAKSLGYYSKNEGSTVLSNIYAVRESGIMLERDSAYQPSWFAGGLPCEGLKADGEEVPAVCYSHNAPDEVQKTKIINADNIGFTGVEKNTNDLIRLLAEERRPITVAIVVNFNGWPQNGDTFYNEDLRKECIADPSSCGGHSVLLTGYDLDKGVFFFKNSWGAGWGQEGYGTMTIDTLDRYAESDFYMANVKGHLEIPADHSVDPLTVEGLKLAAAKDENGKLKINLETNITGARGHLIYMSSFVTKMVEGATGEANDSNTALKALTAAESAATNESYIRAMRYVTRPLDTLNYTSEKPAVLSFVEGIEASLTESFGTDEDALLRTTIYVHTDDSSYKIIKRVFSPIK